MENTVFRKRIDLLRGIISDREYDSLLISGCDNFAWLTLGGRNYVTLNSTSGVCSLLITEDSTVLIVDNIERDRILNEELSEEIVSEIEVFTFNWFDDLKRVLESEFGSLSLGSDTGRVGKLIPPEVFTQLRLTLCWEEIETYRIIGAICDSVLHQEMLGLLPDHTEISVQARIAGALIEKGIEPVLVLVFGEESAMKYRHNLPRDVSIGRRVFVSICARKKGLIASASRSVFFSPDQRYRELHEKVAEIDATAIASSSPGRDIRQVFEQIKLAYAKAGYPDEWKKHHQGGLAGYDARELFGNECSSYSLRSGNVIAWNPTITGVKSEDTAVITETGVEIITFPEKSLWPELDYALDEAVIRRPDVVII